MRYEKYELGKLATIKKVKGLPLDKYETGNIPYVTGSQSNNGVVSYVTAPGDAISYGNCIVVDPIKGLCMYQPDNFVGRGFSGASINALYIEGLNELNAMYIIATIEKYSTKVANYGNLFNSNRLSCATIELPTLDELDENSPYSKEGFVPDFDYMYKRIKEIEQECIKQYLVAIGLNDYEITDEDIETLSSFGYYEKRDSEDTIKVYKEMREFRCGDLFTSQTGDTDLQQKDINGKGTVFINSGVENNGIKGMTDRPAKIFHANTISIDFWGNAYYRDFEYKMATHNHVFSLSGDCIKNKYVGLYIVSKMNYIKNLFSYSNMGTWNKIKELFILLPIKTDANNNQIIDAECKYHPDGYIPDLDFMEKYIKSIEKIIIADVVKYLLLLLKNL